MSLPLLRRAAVAGTWYPADPRALTKEIDRHLSAVAALPLDAPVALIAPHAGLMYSGPIAAHSYKLLSGRKVDVAVLVGPSHYVGFEGVAIYEHGAFDTPLGAIPVAEHCAAAIALASGTVREHPTAHAREHSLEMQLPFLKRVLPDVSIVPLVMGAQQRATIYELAGALTTALASRSAVLIASTDLSHYYDATTAARLDATVIDYVERFEPDKLMDALEARPEHACGGGPMVSVMLAAKALGARQARVLKYGDSGDVSGDKDAVVGYLAAALFK